MEKNIEDMKKQLALLTANADYQEVKKQPKVIAVLDSGKPPPPPSPLYHPPVLPPLNLSV